MTEDMECLLDKEEVSEEPEDYIYAVCEDKDIGVDWFIIFEKKYWDERHSVDDSGIEPEFLGETGFLAEMESHYAFIKKIDEGRKMTYDNIQSGTIEEGKAKLKELGIPESQELTEWLDSLDN